MDDDMPGMPEVPAGTTARPGARRDAAAVLELLQAWDRAETGEIDTDLADVLTRLPDLNADLSPAATLVWAGDQLVAAAFLSGGEGEVYVQPHHPDAATLEVALPRWLRHQADRGGRRLSLQVSADAGERQARYARAGLQYAHSIFQFRRPLTDVPEPVWPPGLAVADWVPERDARNVHALIRTAFSDVQGQPDRDWPTWSAAVLDRTDTDVLTVHDARRLVGAAVLSSYDSYGHVRQLAVERRSRGSGLGKALLLASFQRFATRGLPEVRLGVYASNRAAQNLYEGVGMTLLTEWQVWMPPA